MQRGGVLAQLHPQVYASRVDITFWALVVAWTALALALVSACGTIYAIVRPPRDTDVEELADEVSKLARRSRADTMRRVRAEATAAPPAGLEDVSIPPQLKAQAQASALARDPRAVKDAVRKRLLSGNGGQP